VFLGVPDNFKGWKLWDPSAQGGRGGVIISRDVIWNKEEFPGLSKDAHDPIPAHCWICAMGSFKPAVALSRVWVTVTTI
jgi:hypothetical protein